MENNMEAAQNIKTELLYDPTIPLMYICSKEIKCIEEIHADS